MKAQLAFGLVLVAVSLRAATNSTPDFKMLTRVEWGAKPPIAAMKTNLPVRITIHHTGTPQKPDRTLKEKLKALQTYSQRAERLTNGKTKPAWPDVPYHYYIDYKGDVAEGREVAFVGDTNTEYDTSGHVIVVLEGNFENEQPTDGQIVTLKKMILWLAERYKVPAEELGVHKDYAETLCPGKNLSKYMPKMRELLEKK